MNWCRMLSVNRSLTLAGMSADRSCSWHLAPQKSDRFCYLHSSAGIGSLRGRPERKQQSRMEETSKNIQKPYANTNHTHLHFAIRPWQWTKSKNSSWLLRPSLYLDVRVRHIAVSHAIACVSAFVVRVLIMVIMIIMSACMLCWLFLSETKDVFISPRNYDPPAKMAPNALQVASATLLHTLQLTMTPDSKTSCKPGVQSTKKLSQWKQVE